MGTEWGVGGLHKHERDRAEHVCGGEGCQHCEHNFGTWDSLEVSSCGELLNFQICRTNVVGSVDSDLGPATELDHSGSQSYSLHIEAVTGEACQCWVWRCSYSLGNSSMAVSWVPQLQSQVHAQNRKKSAAMAIESR